MSIKLIALDLDGTALRSDNTLSHTVASAIESAASRGIEIVAASGRPFHSMPKSFLELNILKPSLLLELLFIFYHINLILASCFLLL